MQGASDNLEIMTSLKGNVAVLRCVGRIDANTHEQLDVKLKKQFATGCYKIIIDLTDVAYISSPGAGSIISALSKAEDHKGRIVFLKPNPTVLELFKVIGLTELISVTQDMNSALALF